jgi:hypothetical protein
MLELEKDQSENFSILQPTNQRSCLKKFFLPNKDNFLNKISCCRGDIMLISYSLLHEKGLSVPIFGHVADRPLVIEPNSSWLILW